MGELELMITARLRPCFTDASSGSGYWFHPDGMERVIHAQLTEVWFDEDAYIIGPPNYK